MSGVANHRARNVQVAAPVCVLEEDALNMINGDPRGGEGDFLVE